MTAGAAIRTPLPVPGEHATRNNASQHDQPKRHHDANQQRNHLFLLPLPCGVLPPFGSSLFGSSVSASAFNSTHLSGIFCAKCLTNPFVTGAWRSTTPILTFAARRDEHRLCSGSGQTEQLRNVPEPD